MHALSLRYIGTGTSLALAELRIGSNEAGQSSISSSRDARDLPSLSSSSAVRPARSLTAAEPRCQPWRGGKPAVLTCAAATAFHVVHKGTWQGIKVYEKLQIQYVGLVMLYSTRYAAQFAVLQHVTSAAAAPSKYAKPDTIFRMISLWSFFVVILRLGTSRG